MHEQKQGERLNKIIHTVNNLLSNSMIIILFTPVILSVYCHMLRNSVRRTNNDLT
jgi:hypothetical protein